MIRLRDLYPESDSNVEIKAIKINSRDCTQGDIFVCVSGVTADRHDYIDDAIKNGCSAVVVSKDVGEKNVPIIKVEDTNKELPLLCQKFYDYPNKKLKMIGVTGTDGKTSTTTIIQTLIGDDVCGYIGTNGRSCRGHVGDNPNTTPDAQNLYNYLSEFVSFGCKYASIETSSEAFFRGRLQNLEFDISAITNITSEHLNIHGSFENYLESKLMLFKQTKKDGYSILNRDDEHFDECLKACSAHVLTYGVGEENDLQIVSYKLHPDHTDIVFKYKDKEYNIVSPLMGDFNVYNLACGLLCSIALGFSIDDLIPNISKIRVDGRLELLNTKTPYYVMVDYAHTPNGISKLLNFVHTLDINRSIVVIGQAGERDYLKRPVVGRCVLENASYAIFTMEDPRSEDPMKICEDIVATSDDLKDKYKIVIDRSEAIREAINMANDKDMVLILGKGNETYEKLKNETIYFNDIEEALKAVKEREEKCH